MTYKNVYFHKFRMYRRNFTMDESSADTLDKEYKDKEFVNHKFQNIIDNKLNDFNAVRIDEESHDTIEFIKENEKYIFAKMGRTKDVYAVHLRNNETLEPSPIQIGNDQSLEIFTYLLMDRENFVVSYLREQSAPSIQKLKDLMNFNFGSSENTFAEISSVIIEDAIPLLKDKDTIGTIKYKVSVPPNEMFNIDRLGLTQSQYETLSNQKSVDFEIKLVAERNKDALEDKNKLGSFLTNILGKTKKVKVKAKDNDGYMETFDIVDNAFTRRAKFDFDRNAIDIENEIYKQLVNVYINNKQDILNYVN